MRFYWVVDPATETIHPFESHPSGYLERPPLKPEDVLECPLFRGVTMPVPALFTD